MSRKFSRAPLGEKRLNQSPRFEGEKTLIENPAFIPAAFIERQGGGRFDGINRRQWCVQILLAIAHFSAQDG